MYVQLIIVFSYDELITNFSCQKKLLGKIEKPEPNQNDRDTLSSGAKYPIIFVGTLVTHLFSIFIQEFLYVFMSQKLINAFSYGNTHTSSVQISLKDVVTQFDVYLMHCPLIIFDR